MIKTNLTLLFALVFAFATAQQATLSGSVAEGKNGEALISATRWGGQIMMRRDLGEIREGWLADLLLVDGDPLANISLLQDRTKLLAIMKDGEFAKAPEIRSARSRFIA